MAYEIKTKPGQVARMVRGEEAQRLADLTGVQRDLDRVAHACRVIENRKGSPSTEDVRRACFDSAVLRYRRCFKNGVRAIFPRVLLAQLNAEELFLHDHILEVADKSVAHCVDGSEENFTYVLIGPPEANRIIIDLSVLSGNVSHHNKIDAIAFENLAIAVKAIARAEADRVAVEVMDRLEAGGASGLAALPQINRGISKEGEALTDRYRRQVKA